MVHPAMLPTSVSKPVRMPAPVVEMRQCIGVLKNDTTSEAVSLLKIDIRRGSGNCSQPPIVEA